VVVSLTTVIDIKPVFFKAKSEIQNRYCCLTLMYMVEGYRMAIQ
jgi:hypothetical protein